MALRVAVSWAFRKSKDDHGLVKTRMPWRGLSSSHTLHLTASELGDSDKLIQHHGACEERAGDVMEV
ncbi:hypothetical protein P7K49_027864 [Saguinus oedipus]|uniref:Uncharacterized protein n=1 Tax=Saguinus oedipus TaxID=9490 RepID=A0ABQ9UAU9_SAGOE|nr:hypothetical protein P7K49_027864 [Saguinus oedipus]